MPSGAVVRLAATSNYEPEPGELADQGNSRTAWLKKFPIRAISRP
jgi:hypothetical protein